MVRPEAADPGADKWLEDQFAYVDRNAARAGKLVVYLVGANNKPARGREMARWLAGLGFPVVAPMYCNDYPIANLCAPSADADADCHGKARLEAFEGRDHSTHIEVSRANSAEARVARMLATLARQFPEEGWGDFLEGDNPRWPAIIIAGHSHGASSAALIGKVRAVDRVVMLSGPFDNRTGEVAPWIGRPPVTPLARVFGLSHRAEPQHAQHIKNWQAMPLAGPVAVVDEATPPYGGSHELITALPGDNPHGITAAGGASPRAPDGTYRLASVWRYLFGTPR
jgi:hypothetical protein